MGRLFSAVTRFFVEDEWKFDQVDDQALRMGFAGKNGNWTCIARAREEKGIFLFYSICANNVPEGARPAVAEYLTRANYGLPLGSFELDYADGEVRFKTSVEVEDDEDKLTFGMIKSLIYSNVITFDRYLTGLMKVAYGGARPEEAVAEAEA